MEGTQNREHTEIYDRAHGWAEMDKTKEVNAYAGVFGELGYNVYARNFFRSLDDTRRFV